MGYRSTVKMLFGFDSNIKRTVFIEVVKESMSEADWNWPQSNEFDEGKNQYWWLLEWNDVKWYETYKEVKTWTNVISLADAWQSATWEFIEVGEEEGDTTHKSSGNNNDTRMYTSTNIHVDI